MICLLGVLLSLPTGAGAADGGGERETFCEKIVERGIFQAEFEKEGVAEAFVAGRRWFPYPDYADRAGWERLFGPEAEAVIARGETFLDFQWESIPATAYLAFEREGNRVVMESMETRDREALIALITAELAEGQGRFIDQIVNGVWFCCQQFSWVLSAHQVRQESGRALPDDREHFIDLCSGRRGAILAIAHYFFREEFDRIDPSISWAVRTAVRRQILDPYFDESENDAQWWLGFGDRTGLPGLNNWNPWCNSDTMLCFLLIEEDQERLDRALEMSVRSVDLYLADISSDGACDEGSGYWNIGFGKLYEWMQILFDASGGKFDLFAEPLFRRMGEFISRSYIGGGWAVNFADAAARQEVPTCLVWNFGRAVGSREMTDFALYGLADMTGAEDGKGSDLATGRFSYPEVTTDDMYRAVESVRFSPEIRAAVDSLNAIVDGAPADGSHDPVAQKAAAGSALETVLRDLRKEVPAGTWYDQTQVCFMRNGSGWFLAAKGGNNGENHNHNDVGSCILFIRETPVLVDAGVGVYTAQTFGAGRYGLWTMQSDWHNLPAPSGMSQLPGGEYRVRNVSCDPDAGSLSLDLAGAYLENSLCRSWIRTYDLTSVSDSAAVPSLTVTDRFLLSDRTEGDAEHFLVRGRVILPGGTFGGSVVPDGELLIICDGGQKPLTVRMKYSDNLSPAVEDATLDDPKLEASWGPMLRRISLTSSDNAPTSGEYKIEISEY